MQNFSELGKFMSMIRYLKRQFLRGEKKFWLAQSLLKMQQNLADLLL